MGDKESQTYQKLVNLFIMTALIFTFQLLGGILTDSLALVADSFHVMVDLSSIGIALFALNLSQRPHSSKLTFGFHRAEIVAAFINGIFLVVTAALILYETYGRFLRPHEIDSVMLLSFASVSLCANIFMATTLNKESRTNLNIKGVYLHVLGDLGSLIGIIIGALILLIFHILYADSSVSLAIGALILFSGLRLCKKCLHVFMEGTPEELKFSDVYQALENTEGVTEVHDLHLWVLTSNLYAMSVHIKVHPSQANKSNDLLNKINHTMREQFGITHCTIQIESDQDFIKPTGVD